MGIRTWRKGEGGSWVWIKLSLGSFSSSGRSWCPQRSGSCFAAFCCFCQRREAFPPLFFLLEEHNDTALACAACRWPLILQVRLSLKTVADLTQIVIWVCFSSPFVFVQLSAQQRTEVISVLAHSERRVPLVCWNT